MTKNNRITADMLEQLINEGSDDIPVSMQLVEWNGLNIEVTHTLSIKDAFSLVQDVVDMSFLEDGTYAPEVTDFAMRAGVIDYYTNIDLPEKMEDRYRLVYSLPINEVVIEHINRTQFEVICDAAERRIEMLCDTDVLAMRERINTLLDALDELAGNADKLFGSVQTGDIAKLSAALANGTIDEEKIVKALTSKPKRAAKKK